jgi:hypothetical protein
MQKKALREKPSNNLALGRSLVKGETARETGVLYHNVNILFK